MCCRACPHAVDGLLDSRLVAVVHVGELGVGFGLLLLENAGELFSQRLLHLVVVGLESCGERLGVDFVLVLEGLCHSHSLRPRPCIDRFQQLMHPMLCGGEVGVCMERWLGRHVHGSADNGLNGRRNLCITLRGSRRPIVAVCVLVHRRSHLRSHRLRSVGLVREGHGLCWNMGRQHIATLLCYCPSRLLLLIQSRRISLVVGVRGLGRFWSLGSLGG
mmetsp:Transcript_13535/g.29215  ORF Transcript_13535/g.29215 Transcript_13535/m.29215 type:complete len:218 (+) Transcript_13535:769-1422(+)